jgi:hypothetical protein
MLSPCVRISTDELWGNKLSDHYTSYILGKLKSQAQFSHPKNGNTNTYLDDCGEGKLMDVKLPHLHLETSTN